MIVLDRNILTCDVYDVGYTDVHLTVLGGASLDEVQGMIGQTYVVETLHVAISAEPRFNAASVGRHDGVCDCRGSRLACGVTAAPALFGAMLVHGLERCREAGASGAGVSDGLLTNGNKVRRRGSRSQSPPHMNNPR